MASSYTSKVVRDDDGNELSIKSGGVIDVESGGAINVTSGGILDVKTGGIIKANGTQAAHIADVPTAGSADAAANATAINSIILVLEGAGLTALS